jgi:galactokinase
MNYIELHRLLRAPEGMERLGRLYGRREGMLVEQMGRYGSLIKFHEELFRAPGSVRMVSSPGRTEILGNHTDHNKGKVLAAAINLDALAVVSPRHDQQVHLISQGYEPIELHLGLLEPREDERGTSAALVRGVADGMQRAGYRLGGFEAVITSDVLSGSGLSSSAAFEVLICTILDLLYNGQRMSAVERAKICQHAENVHFGKPSGLMDQMASSVGGMTYIDFEQADPVVEPLSFHFHEAGYAMVVVGTGASHDDLTADYAAIRTEMQHVAQFFGADSLRRVRPDQFYGQIRQLRCQVNDRAVLRAIHYFGENQRVEEGAAALKAGDVECFFTQVRASGRSSWQLLQNLSTNASQQPLAIALAVAEEQLQGRGACRVHGGGFGGTTLNFVPLEMVDGFVKAQNAIFGDKSCFVLDVRPEGACAVW